MISQEVVFNKPKDQRKKRPYYTVSERIQKRVWELEKIIEAYKKEKSRIDVLINASHDEMANLKITMDVIAQYRGNRIGVPQIGTNNPQVKAAAIMIPAALPDCTLPTSKDDAEFLMSLNEILKVPNDSFPRISQNTVRGQIISLLEKGTKMSALLIFQKLKNTRPDVSLSAVRSTLHRMKQEGRVVLMDGHWFLTK
jgi:hypothetical protein